MGSVSQLVGNIFSWLAREHCDRNPDAVVTAWQDLNSPPTIADCGRLLAAYGRDFTVEEVAYISAAPEPLRFARYVSGGSRYISYQNARGYVPRPILKPLKQGSLSRPLIGFGVGALITAFIALRCLAGGNNAGALAYGIVVIVLLFLALLEFVDVRQRHYAGYAIEISREYPSRRADTNPDSGATTDTVIDERATSRDLLHRDKEAMTQSGII